MEEDEEGLLLNLRARCSAAVFRVTLLVGVSKHDALRGDAATGVFADDAPKGTTPPVTPIVPGELTSGVLVSEIVDEMGGRLNASESVPPALREDRRPSTLTTRRPLVAVLRKSFL